MNPRIFVGIAIVGIIGAIAAIAFSGTAVVSDVSDNTTFMSQQQESDVLPLKIQLEDIIIEQVDEKAAFVEVKFKVTNPNQKSILLQLVRYTLYEDIKNTGNTPELWNALTTNTPKWRITGDAFYNLSSMTAGGENELAFEFTK